MIDDVPEPYIEHEGKTYPLEAVDPVKNAKRRRKLEPEEQIRRTGFDPNASLLERVRERIRGEEGDS